MRDKIILQPSEWTIMEKLWEASPKTITQLYHALEEETGWSKSTVNTLLGRMVKKGIVIYQEGEKAKLYQPNVQREDAAAAETKSLLDRIYKGSVSMMLSTLVRAQGLSDDDIQELYQILEGQEAKK